MSPFSASPLVRHLRGRVVSVDAANRLVRVWDGRQSVEMLVPPGCEVRLNTESIRLRLLEPGDPVEVDVIESEGGTIAAAIQSRSAERGARSAE
jgi:hypothetical protein